MGLIRRLGTKEFTYEYVKSQKPVTSADILQRIKNLHIPPAYTQVVISDNPKDKIQAYGYDKKGRKQIRYAPWFLERQRQKKFARVMAMEETVRAVEADVAKTLRLSRPTKEVMVCMIVRLMMLCNFRIGSRSHVRKHKTYGLSTLEWRHLRIRKSSVSISFIGKKGVLNEGVCQDPDVVRLLRKMQKGVEIDTERVFNHVTAADVNAYLKTFNADITSKDIRTWQANALFVKYFVSNKENETNMRKRQRLAIEHVAKELHHTVAVCKSSYLLPEFTQRV